MSNQLHDGERQRRKQVKFRAPESLVEAFDQWCDNEGLSRSEAIRQQMAGVVEDGGGVTYDTPRQPPSDDRLADPYRRLCAMATRDGFVSLESATTALASTASLSKDGVKREIIRPLVRRGYLNWGGTYYDDYSALEIREPPSPAPDPPTVDSRSVEAAD